MRDTPDNLKEFEQSLGAQLHNVGADGPRVSEDHPLSAEDQQLAELVVTENSPLNGRTLGEARAASEKSWLARIDY